MRKLIFTIIILALLSCGSDEYSYYIEVKNESDASVLLEFTETTVSLGQGPVDTAYVRSGLSELINIRESRPYKLDEFSPTDALGKNVSVTFQDSVEIIHTTDNMNILDNHLFDTNNYDRKQEVNERLYTSAMSISVLYSYTFTNDDLQEALDAD